MSGEVGSSRALIAAAGGGGLFVGLWLALGIPLAWSAAAGAAGYGALWLMLKARRPREERAPFSEPFVDKELAKRTVAQARLSARALREIAGGGSDPIAARFAKLADRVEAIAVDVEADPKDAVPASAFLGVQGEAAVRLGKLAAGLESRGASSAQLTEARRKIGVSLDRLIASTEKQLASLQEDNLAELQAELDVIEEGLFLEGELSPSVDAADAGPARERAARKDGREAR